MTLLTLDDLTQQFKLSRSYVRDKLVKRGDFPRPSLSLSQKNRRWGKSDVDAWIAKSQADLQR